MSAPPSSAFGPPTFYRGTFHLGDSTPFDVEEDDFACEYSHMHYLAAATCGEEVAVGQLYVYSSTADELAEARSPSPSWVCEVSLVMLPDVGIWLCEPLFESIAEADDHLELSVRAIENALQRAIDELPIQVGLFEMTDRTQRQLSSVDRAFYYERSVFADPARALRSRSPARHRPQEVNHTIERLLEAGDWIDAKDGFYLNWPIPRWLHDQLCARRGQQAA